MDKLKDITLDTEVVRNDKNFMTSPVGDEIVMMSMESGNYIGLNNLGTVIWNKLGTPIKVADLVKYLLENYDITEEECTSKTIGYLRDMAKQDMLIIIN